VLYPIVAEVTQIVRANEHGDQLPVVLPVHARVVTDTTDQFRCLRLIWFLNSFVTKLFKK
jgi:hypothetical protein